MVTNIENTLIISTNEQHGRNKNNRENDSFLLKIYAKKVLWYIFKFCLHACHN